MDPPWPNISVSRSSHYDTFLPSRLQSIPIPRLLDSSGAYVAVWVTNNMEYHELVQILFISWGLDYIGTWYYLKITDDGSLAIPSLTSRHRKSFECLMIGQISCQNRHGFHKRYNIF